MKISTDSVNETRQDTERRIDEQKTSDRFSQLLKSKNEQANKDKQNQQQKQANSKGDSDGGAQQKSEPTALNLPSTISLDTNVSRFSPSPIAANPEKSTQPGVSAPPQIDKLTNEIGDQIDIFKQGGKAEAVNITFDSKTLEGLQVQIRQQDGEMGIRFITQSDNVSKLLSQHTGELRDSLTSKGVKIGNIAISNTQNNSRVTQRNGYTGA